MSLAPHLPPDLRRTRLSRQWRAIAGARPPRLKSRGLGLAGVLAAAVAAAAWWSMDRTPPQPPQQALGARDEVRDREGVRRPIVRLAPVGLAYEGLAATAFRCESTDGQRARPADAFVDSVGVNVFLHYSDTAYNDLDLVEDRLSALGVRHIFVPGATEPVIERVASLGRRLGVKAMLALDSTFDARSTAEECVGRAGCREATSIAVALGGHLEGFVMGGREPADPQSIAEEGSRYPRLRASLAADPRTRHVRLVSLPVRQGGPTAAPDSAVDTVGVGWRFTPASPGVAFDRLLPLMPAAGDRPRHLFWVFWLSSQGGAGLGERVHAKYVARALLESFRRGFGRLYLHDLLDAKPAWVAGLLRNDLTPKPAFDATARLVTLLSDAGPAFEPGRLGYRVEGGSAALRQLLLQKRDGTFYLVLWREQPSASTDQTEEVTVAFDTRIEAVEMFRPLEGIEPRYHAAWPTQVRAVVPDHPLIVRIAALCP